MNKVCDGVYLDAGKVLIKVQQADLYCCITNSYLLRSMYAVIVIRNYVADIGKQGLMPIYT